MNKWFNIILFKTLPMVLVMVSLTVPGCNNEVNQNGTPASDTAVSPSITSTPFTPEDVFDIALWNDPPMENRPYVRWWWPGGAVEEDRLKSDLDILVQSGFGGVEIQPLLLGFTQEEIGNNPNIRTVGTPEFFEKVRLASQEAHKIGMGLDVTLGSGWSTGVPDASEAAEKQLLMSNLEVKGPIQYEGSLPIPDPPAYRDRINAIMDVVGPFDENLTTVAVTAAKIVAIESETPVFDLFVDITEFVKNGNLKWDVPDGTWQIFTFYQNNTNHAPVGGAYPGKWHEAFIIDHFDSSGAQKLIDNYGNPLLNALGKHSPDAIFIDSFEMVGELPWTSRFRDQFKQETGYDITPFLPLMFQKNGESKYTRMTDLMGGLELTPIYTSTDDIAIRIREDYEEVRGRLFLEEFCRPIIDWGHANGIELRMQAQGGWADYLDTYQMADIPETEALFAMGTFDFFKLAASGAHISGNKFAGSESFIRLSGNPHAITLEDFYMFGGKALSAGINRIVYHGFPYSYIRENGEGWYPLSGEAGTLRAGPISFTSWISENHPVWPNLPEFNQYLARLSYATSCGNHKSDIAWLYPDWEYPDNPMDSGDESEISLSLKHSGFVYDRISRQNLTDAIAEGNEFAVGEARYEALLISELDIATPEMMASIEKLADAGVPIIVLKELPNRAPGFFDYEQRDAATQQIADRLQPKVMYATDESSIGIQLMELSIQPALIPSDDSKLVFAPEHRTTANEDILMLFNESAEAQTQILDILLPAKQVQVLDPQTGSIITEITPNQQGQLSIDLSIPAGRSVILIAKQE